MEKTGDCRVFGGAVSKGFGLRGTCPRATHRQVLAPFLVALTERLERKGLARV